MEQGSLSVIDIPGNKIGRIQRSWMDIDDVLG
jgi:hypothetical protein